MLLIKLRILLLCFLFIHSIQAKTILLIHSYHKEYEWVKGYTAGINSVTNINKYKVIHFYMNTKRLPESEHLGMASKAWIKFNEVTPDFVFLADDASMKHLAFKFMNLDVPVVYFGINNNPRKYFDKGNNDNFTGILERPLLKRSLHHLKEILPKSKSVLILFDSGLTSQVLIDSMKKWKLLKIMGVKVDLKVFSSWEYWKKAVLDSKGQYDTLIVGLYHTLVNSDGNHVPPEEVIKWTSKNTPIPPLGLWDFAVGKNKTIGGLLVHANDIGIMAGEIALEILQFGTKPKEITPKTLSSGRFIFSRTQMKKWKIQLPVDIKRKSMLID